MYYTVSSILYLDMNAQQRLKYEQATERHNKRMANKTANDMDWKWFMKPFTMFEHIYFIYDIYFFMWILITYGYAIIIAWSISYEGDGIKTVDLIHLTVLDSQIVIRISFSIHILPNTSQEEENHITMDLDQEDPVTKWL